MRLFHFLLILSCCAICFNGTVTAENAPKVAGNQVDSDSLRRDAVVRAVERVMPSVVNISTETVVERRSPFGDIWQDFFGRYYGNRRDVQYSLGSGVIIDEEGYLLTNLHVVQRATRIWVSLADGRKFEAEAVSNLSSSDVALLRLKCAAEDRFTAIHFAAEDDLLLGETVIALGNPFGLGGSVSRGILSSKNRRPEVEGAELDIQDWLQIDAAINPGNSGGPLVNLNGDLIGLNVAIHREGDGIGFAIPVRALSEAVAVLLSPEEVGGVWFGGVFENHNGVSVKSVEHGSPVEKAGIKPGDVLLSVNGKEVRGIIHANRLLLSSRKKGLLGGEKPLELKLRRGEETLTKQVTLVPETEVFNADYVQRRLGIGVEKLTPETAEALGVQMMDAFAVMSVDNNCEAFEKGLQPGMMIYGVDGVAVVDVVDFARILHGKGSGGKVRLAIRIQRRTGNFIQQRDAEIELSLR